MSKVTRLYRHWDTMDNLLYVGISKSTLQRLGAHEANSHWYNSIVKVTIEAFPTRQEALEAEKKAIETECPLHNKQYNEEGRLPVIHRFRHDSIDEPYWFEITSTKADIIHKFIEIMKELCGVTNYENILIEHFNKAIELRPEYKDYLYYDDWLNHLYDDNGNRIPRDNY